MAPKKKETTCGLGEVHLIHAQIAEIKKKVDAMEVPVMQIQSTYVNKEPPAGFQGQGEETQSESEDLIKLMYTNLQDMEARSNNQDTILKNLKEHLSQLATIAAGSNKDAKAVTTKSQEEEPDVKAIIHNKKESDDMPTISKKFQVGQKILLWKANSKKSGGRRRDRLHGPFTITKPLPQGNIEIDLGEGKLMTVKEHRIKPYIEEKEFLKICKDHKPLEAL